MLTVAKASPVSTTPPSMLYWPGRKRRSRTHGPDGPARKKKIP